ncbi:MAG: PQQ-binding-like beta-propeller repeat protein [Propylenella sp.]
MKKTAAVVATLVILAVLVGGCSAISALNPFREKDKILPGERRAALPQGAYDVVGGTPVIGPAEPLAEWPQPGGNAANAPGHVSLSGASATSAWRVSAVPKASKRNVRPAVPPIVHNGQIYVYDTAGTVTALAAGGGKAWSYSLAPEGEKSRPAGGGIAASGSAIFAATGFGQLVALDAATGGRIWTFDMSAPAHSAPTAANGKVFVVSATNVLHAVNQADGTEAWQYPGIPETAGVLSAASPAVSGNIVVVPYSSGEVIAFDAESGEPRWADAVVRSTRTLAVSGLTDVAASPVIYDGVVYATGVSGRTIAVRVSDGERLWEENIGSASTPAVSGNAIFVVDLQDNMVALDRMTGTVFWRTALPVVRKKRFFSVWTGPTLAGGALWAVSNDRKMVGVDPALGSIVVERELPSPAYVKPIAAAGQLILLSADGSLAAFR